MQPFVVKLPPAPLHGEGFKHVTQEPFIGLSAGATRLDHTLNPEVYSLLAFKPPEVYFPLQSSEKNPQGFVSLTMFSPPCSLISHKPPEDYFSPKLSRFNTLRLLPFQAKWNSEPTDDRCAHLARTFATHLSGSTSGKEYTSCLHALQHGVPLSLYKTCFKVYIALTSYYSNYISSCSHMSVVLGLLPG